MLSCWKWMDGYWSGNIYTRILDESWEIWIKKWTDINRIYDETRVLEK